MNDPKRKLDITQVQTDLNSLSSQAFEAKYPQLKGHVARGMDKTALEEKITKFGGSGGMPGGGGGL